MTAPITEPITRPIQAMRPRLRTNVFFAPSRDGTGALCLHGERIITLRGASTYQWLERLTPYLDGRFTVDELVSLLPSQRQEMAQRLVAVLHDAGLVRDTALDLPHTLTDKELEAYAPEIAFVEAFADSPAQRFQRYRDSLALAIGSGTTVVAMVSGLLRSGVRRVTAALTEPTDIDTLRDALEDQRAQAAIRDPEQQLDWRAFDPDAPFVETVAGADIVLHACDIADVPRALAVDRACHAGSAALVTLLVAGDQAWVGPACPPDGVRWAELWRRLRAGGGLDATPTEFFTGPVPGIVANHAVFAAFEYATGVAKPDAPTQAVCVDLETLQTNTYRLVAFPPVRMPSEPAKACATLVQQLAAGAELTTEALAARTAAISDDRLGVLTPIAEPDHDQFPLRVAQTTVSARGSRVTVLAAALDSEEAATRTRLAALARYAVLTTGRPTHGVCLTDGRVREIPLAAWTQEAGVAAGLSWAAAVEAGLLEHCLRLAVQRAESREAAPYPADDVIEHYLSLLDAAGQEIAIADITASPAVPAFAFRLGGDLCGDPVAYRAGLTVTEALRDGLRAVVQAYQSRSANQPAYAPALIASDQHLLCTASERRRATLVQALRDAGRVPVVVPLGQDETARQALPYVLRVVLLDA